MAVDVKELAAVKSELGEEVSDAQDPGEAAGDIDDPAGAGDGSIEAEGDELGDGEVPATAPGEDERVGGAKNGDAGLKGRVPGLEGRTPGLEGAEGRGGEPVGLWEKAAGPEGWGKGLKVALKGKVAAASSAGDGTVPKKPT